ncbi:hypothetical protein Ccrd_000954 [Cynara cardunculus var. scolymus]|uniref:Retrotransposon gag domain-containing protein n=1 Tax=Cynara cardunculus var. scolymus TaxID=59895 RepID=A0A103XU50_CYNCS|nr:hypothetical protein Ccrd_000954 [Cynara cardunculus var. scolymus]
MKKSEKSRLNDPQRNDPPNRALGYIPKLEFPKFNEIWMSSYIAIKKNVDWTEFIIDLSARFKDDVRLNVVKFKLQQTGYLESYVDEFENIRSVILQQNNMLPDSPST